MFQDIRQSNEEDNRGDNEEEAGACSPPGHEVYSFRAGSLSPPQKELQSLPNELFRPLAY